MSKTLITALGLIVSLGVIALGVFLVALPIYVQSVGVDAQTATVANTNAIYQAQVDSLTRAGGEPRRDQRSRWRPARRRFPRPASSTTSSR